MAFARGFSGGEGIMAPEKRRERMTEHAAIRERAASMYMMKLIGRSSSYIGIKFRISGRHVNREIASLSKTMKQSLEREHRRGQQSLARLESA